jgi:formyltetrahydrofolate hydrolase
MKKKNLRSIDAIVQIGDKSFRIQLNIKSYQMLHCTKIQLYFVNCSIQDDQVDFTNKRIRRAINHFLKGLEMQENMFYSSQKDDELGISCLRDEKSIYRIHRFSYLLMKNEEKKIIQEYLRLKDLLYYLNIYRTLEQALNQVNIEWID